ncbi:hypothetical protein GCM10022239_13230 [Leifsonia bigeumensis]|uniref:Isochorismatase-like domain-containing protein n=1 Tax=Leifsonella bigeumensis TaxID=433643 RepID=A0ABP7FHW7_9MICO
MRLDEKTAVIVVDMQNDFCSSEGALAGLGADVSRNQEVAARLPFFLQRAREKGALVIWILQNARAEFVSEARRERASAMGRGVTAIAAAGTWGAELYDGLVPQPGDVALEKSKYSAFVGTPLRNLLQARARTKLVVCGTAANVCVDSTVRDAYMADFTVALPRDLVGSTRAALGESAIENLGIYFCEVVESEEIVAAESDVVL